MNTFRKGTIVLYRKKEKSPRPTWIYIYGLFDKRDRRIRYVGRTNNPETRLRNHVRESFGRFPMFRHVWMKELLAENLYPSMIILDIVPYEDRKEREREWIYKMHEKHGPLLNQERHYQEFQQQNADRLESII